MTDTQRKVKLDREQNVECALVIVADPIEYPPESLPGTWARMVLDRSAETTTPPTRRTA